MLTVFADLRAIKNNIVELINVSGYKNEYIASKMGLTAQNFAVKKQRGKWSADELEKIMELLTQPNEDVEDLLMVELMRSRKDNETVPLTEIKKEFGWK